MGRARPQRAARPAHLRRARARSRRRRVLPALAPDPAAYARARARRHRGPRRPARGAAALDPRGRRRGGGRRHDHGAQRQRARADRSRRRRRGTAGWTTSTSTPRSAGCSPTTPRSATTWWSLGDRVLVVNRNPVRRARSPGRLGDDAARPHRAARAAERAQRAPVDHQHPARADPRVPQPAAHHLRPGAAGGVRRGVAARRHPEPAPRRDLRRGARPTSRTRPSRPC